MKNVVLTYAGDRSGALYDILNRHGIQVHAYTDKEKAFSRTQTGHFISSVETARLLEEGLADHVIISGRLFIDQAEKLAEEFYTLGVDPDKVLAATPRYYLSEDEKDIIRFKDYHCLHFLEFHAADHCNLNCSGCTHFSPLVPGEVFPDPDALRQDLTQLRKVVEYIDKIHILGGEPLLNRQLDLYLDMVREFYPFSTIEVHTNGTLLNQMPDRLVESFLRNDINIFVTLYPPMYKSIEKIMKAAADKGLNVRYYTLSKFSRIFDVNGGHSAGVRQLSCRFPNLYQGKLYPCPSIAYVRYFNDAFDQNISSTEGAVDLYQDIDFDTLKRELHKVRSICDHCLFISKDHEITGDWELSCGRKLIGDYVYGL
ncbi:MAG: radical SAM protein [Eubacteriales bacterium]|nr:radical SAM protein [Eubacteriales bacterium]